MLFARFAASLALVVALGGVHPAFAEVVITGVVVGIADGDTLTLLDARRQQHRVRLAGIDAPEKRQAFGQRAKQSLSAMAYLRLATVHGTKSDRYGRLLGKVIVGGVDLNLRQLEVGMAWHYKAYQREQSALDREAYADAENAARASLRGLWAMPRPMPPWEFRRRGTRARRDRRVLALRPTGAAAAQHRAGQHLPLGGVKPYKLLDFAGELDN